jgi:hypothetical protein
MRDFAVSLRSAPLTPLTLVLSGRGSSSKIDGGVGALQPCGIASSMLELDATRRVRYSSAQLRQCQACIAKRFFAHLPIFLFFAWAQCWQCWAAVKAVAKSKKKAWITGSHRLV